MARTKTAERDLLPPGTKQDLYIETAGRCAHCGKRLNYHEATVDHVIPISKGGQNSAKNLTVLCEPCNKAKYNHVIEPAKYYPFLEPRKLAKLQAMFEKYLDETDWFGWENLFRTDLFDLDARHAVMAKTSGKIFMAPMQVTVRKLVPMEAYDWLQLYRAHIRAQDRCLVIDDPRHIEHPFYKITDRAGKEIALAECYMGFDTNSAIHPDIPCVMVNWFTHWGLKYKAPASDYTMFYVIKAFVGEIQDTLVHTAEKSLCKLKLTSVMSDSHIPKMLRIVPDHAMHPFEENDFVGLDPDAATTGFTSMLFQGGQKEILELMEEHGVKHESDLYKKADHDAMAKPLLDKLKAQPEDEKPDRPVYADMGHGYAKHKKKKKRH